MGKLGRAFSKVFSSSSSSDDESAASTSVACSDTVLKNMKAVIAAGESSDLKEFLETVGKSVTSEGFQDLMLYALKKVPVDNGSEKDGYAKILEVLMDAGAEIDAIKYGETLLVKAITDNQKDILDHFLKVKILLDAGAGVYIEGMSESALHSLFMMENAFGSKALGVAKLLLEHGGNPYSVNKEGQTVIYYANQYHQDEIAIKKLISTYDLDHPGAKQAYIQAFKLVSGSKAPAEYLEIQFTEPADITPITEATSSVSDMPVSDVPKGHVKRTHITQETIDYILSIVDAEVEVVGDTCTTSSELLDTEASST